MLIMQLKYRIVKACKKKETIEKNDLFLLLMTHIFYNVHAMRSLQNKDTQSG